MIGPDLRLLLFPGILGGFTTFSAFGYETFALMHRGESFVAMSYILLSVIGGVILLWLGYKVMVAGH
jgi:CrcB protein